MAELLNIETYNDTQNKVEVIFRKLHVDYPAVGEPFICVICDEIHSGAAGNYVAPFTMYATNDIRVPVYKMTNGQPEPVMVVPTPTLKPGDAGYEPEYQETIGEFDLWRQLLFDNNLISINTAIKKGIQKKKGLISEPLAFIRP